MRNKLKVLVKCLVLAALVPTGISDRVYADTIINSMDTDNYILPESGYTYLLYEDILEMTAQELCYARNEIFARYGRKFNSSELNHFFNTKSWYQGIYDPDSFPNELLSECEKENVQVLLKREYELCPDGYVLDQNGYQEKWISSSENIDFSGSPENKAYAELLYSGETVECSSGASYVPEYYYLFDMDGNGVNEILFCAEDDWYCYHWKIYSYEQEKGAYLVAQDEQMDIGNAGHGLCILEGNCLLEHAWKGVVTYDAEWDNYIYFENGEVQYLNYRYVNRRNYGSDMTVLSVEEETEYTLNGENISIEDGKKRAEKYSKDNVICYLNEEGNGVVAVNNESIKELAAMQ